MPDRELNQTEHTLLVGLNPIYRPPIRQLLMDQEAVIGRLRQDRETTVTGKVYHYTNEGGLRGILGNGTLLMSDFTKMRDSVEIKFGVDEGMAVLKEEFEREYRASPPHRLFFENVTTVIGKGLSHYFGAYILSTSLDGDSLTQWERYADTGAGYCLAFESSDLDQAFIAFGQSNAFASWTSFEVLYDRDQLRDWMRQFVRNALNTVSRLFFSRQLVSQFSHALAEVSTNLLAAMMMAALYFKHPSYLSEREYRFLVASFPEGDSRRHLPGLRTRQSGAREIDYLTFDWAIGHRHALTSISTGPGKPHAEGRRIITEALSSLGLSTTITQSGIPPTVV